MSWRLASRLRQRGKPDRLFSGKKTVSGIRCGGALGALRAL
ncbi:MAG TPA: hypothetical protein PLI05_06100 [Methanotrichaceae archaeon]|nr:hypothetical protein [Methanotrichaceae archaeon]HQI91255.1 hypothetical protein [Methanotrichaceae archaeon]